MTAHRELLGSRSNHWAARGARRARGPGARWRAYVAAMPLSPQDFEIFTDHHLQWEGMECPVCKTSGWQIGYIATAPLYTLEDGVAVYQPTGIPLVLLTCNTCFYVRQFAWRPIQERAEARRG